MLILFIRHDILYDMDKLYFKDRIEDIEEICRKYKNVEDTVTNMAKTYNTTTRTIQRILKGRGIIRSIPEANRVTSKLKDYSNLRLPEELKKKRKTLKKSLRYRLILSHPFCSVCGNTANICPLNIDHIDNDPTNNELSNLQILCMMCNHGKKYTL